MISKFFYNLVGKNKKLKSRLWASWYNYLARISKDDKVYFLNYGYYDPDEKNPIKLNDEDEDNRICIQLYHNVANAINLDGKDLMEMSCGQGGGSSYISRYLKPKSYIGSDRTADAIKFCQKTHKADGLSYQVGDALDMPFKDQQFDAVVNVEASHCYPDFDKFMSEVYRVLKPGGYFLYTDFRRQELYDDWKVDMQKPGLKIIEEDDITARVVLGMDKNSGKYIQTINRIVPRFARKYFYQFAGTKGTVIYNQFAKREKVYIRFVLQKPE